MKTKAEFKAQHDPSNEVRFLRGRVAELESLMRREQRISGEYNEALSAVIEAVPVASPQPLIYEPRKSRGAVESPVTMVAHATDWHIGATTKPEYVEEFGSFSYSEAVSRIAAFKEKLTNKAETVRSSYKCDECVVIGTADWVSGDIHEELVRTNEFPCPVQAVKAGFLLGDLLIGLASHFKTVRAEILTAGNHDRVTKKSQCEQGALNSWGFITVSIAEQ
jgi:hypothetical protein